MNGLSFEVRTPALPSSVARADVVAFVGRVALRSGRLPADVLRQWREAGFGEWLASDGSAADARPTRPLPVTVESIAAFDALFDGWVRTAEGLRWQGYTAGAVRDFFRQGGRRAVIVPSGDPAPPPSAAEAIDLALAQAIPDVATFSAPDRAGWHGLGHLVGLPEVATVCLPDLPMLVGAPLAPARPLPGEPVGNPEFAECSVPDPRPPVPTPHRAPLAPHLDDAHFDRWQTGVRSALAFILRHRPDVQLLLALPLWREGHAAEADPLGAGLALRLRPYADGGLGSSRLQLVYPWIGTDASQDRPGAIAPADGLLAGLIAHGALANGAFRSISGVAPDGIRSLSPALSPRAVRLPRPGPSGIDLSLAQRVSLVSSLPRGFRVISDVTTSGEPAWRQAGVNRLVGLLRRAHQRIGETVVFEASGPQTWRALRRRLGSFLAALRSEGAFADTATPYEVRCDETTMTPNDLDNGRLVARIEFTPAQTVERIAVVLAVSGASGELSLEDGRAA